MLRQSPWPFRAAVLLSCGLYVCACAAPAVYSLQASLGGGPDYYQTYMGWTCLLFGWLDFGEVGTPGVLAWLANPLALVGAVLLLFRRSTGAAAFGALSVALGMLYLFFPGGHPNHPDVPLVGAWLWLCSFVVLTIAAMIRRRGGLSEKHAEPLSRATDLNYGKSTEQD